MRSSMRVTIVGLAWSAVMLGGRGVAVACTGFCATGGGQVLVGNNEDYNNPRTKIWFVPAKEGTFGRLYVGFDDLWPQGGMNERGLWFDGYAAPAMKASGSSKLPGFPGNIIDKAMAECTTVEEVVQLFSQYNRAFLTEAILMFADASGDAVSIEPNAIVRKTRSYFVQTNFHQSLAQGKTDDDRFRTATAMLERAGGEISTDLFRRILAATHQKGGAPTLYSNIYDLKSRRMHLYYFHDFERVVTFDLAEELKKGEHALDIPALFPRNADAEAFATAVRTNADQGPSVGAVLAVSAALLCALVAGAVYGWLRASRLVRIGLAVVGIGAIGSVALGVVALHSNRRSSAPWIRFSIGPASGDSLSFTGSTLRANGVTLKAALAIAYDIPPVRVIGPPWVGDTRYSINAVLGVESADAFRPLFQQELKDRLHLDSHIELRPFDVFVLTAGGSPRLEASRMSKPSTWLGRQQARLQGASMGTLASALQSVLGKPVIDETGITGTYDIEFDWTTDRVTSVTAGLRNRFGLELSPAERKLEALVVDGIRRDAALFVLAHVGRMTRGAPPQLRRHIAEMLTID
jgi:uncharacterized protein (TIGR03435 family)